MVDHLKIKDANPWHPITNPIDLKTLGKFIEELNECGSAASRCIIQGINESHPETGKLNSKWLEDEIADVEANIQLVKERFNLNIDQDRIAVKLKHLRNWHSLA